MSYSGETADEFMRFTMEGTKVVAQITGAGAKELVALMLAILNDKKETIGKTRLKNMLKSGKELKVFTIRENDLKTFQENAKRYGISYTALVNRKNKNKNKDGIVDILVKAEDAQRIDRIVERFSLMIDESAKVRTDVRKARDEKLKNEQEENQNNIELSEENENDKAKPVLKEGQSVQDEIKKEMLTVREKRKLSQLKEKNENFSEAKTEVGRPLEPELEKSKNATPIKKEVEYYRPSVRKTMRQLRYRLEKEQKMIREEKAINEKNKNPKHLRKGYNAIKHKNIAKHSKTTKNLNRAKNSEKVR